ncbi:MAG: adenosylcobalamin-dependent ribonucleoside-diphosphate reductase [Desulfurococcales archaeon]|nr:adenosylcobalamin-dependent ribonucleoside-diphosphate reductase [Desulfurococcales archaeon]
MIPSNVIKRDGRKEPFSLAKLRASIRKAVLGAGLSEEDALDLLDEVLKSIEEREVYSAVLADKIAKIMIERGITNPKWFEAAKRFELAHIYNDVYGKSNWNEFNERDLLLSFNALKVLEARYLLKDPETWRFRETPQMLFQRTAKYLAEVEKDYGKSDEEVEKYAKKFYDLLSTLRFMPNSPTLMNSGTRLKILSACFVVPVRDAMTTPDQEGIMDALRAQVLIHQSGGGTGFDFSELRPENDIVTSSGGLSSGPLSFMRLFDVATDVVKQGGKRRGANMGIMHVWHPDIEKFILAKTGQLKDTHLQNFNISVGFYDSFFKALENNEQWPLINPRKTDLRGERDSRYYAISRARHYLSDDWVQEVIINELEENGGSISLDESLIVTIDEAIALAEEEDAIVKWINPKDLFEKIVTGAWESGDPGFLNIDEINRRHPTWYLGKINATNPCGEEPLLPWEACNLGSINLEKYIKDDEIDWEGLAKDVRLAIRLLDNVIDRNLPPLQRIRDANLRTRKVGLGVMGWARFLIKLGIPYDSTDAIRLAWSVAEWIAWNAYMESIELSKEKGPFPAWNPKLYRWLHETLPYQSPDEYLRIVYKETGRKEFLSQPSEKLIRLLEKKPKTDWNLVKEQAMKFGLRNAALLSIAPTGSISIIAGASSSIEPLFALAFLRRVAVGEFIEVDPLFLEELAKREMDEPEVFLEVAETGSIQHLKWIPRSLRKIFKTAHDIDPEWHLLQQAVWQAWIDAGTSKTINLRHDEPIETVRRIYLLAWKLGIKGTTVYRDRSKSEQVIYFGLKEKEKKDQERKDHGKHIEYHEEYGEVEVEYTRDGRKVLKPVNESEDLPALIVEPVKETVETSPETTAKQAPENIETRHVPGKTKLRLGSGKVKEVVAVAEDYAGGCPTCDI